MYNKIVYPHSGVFIDTLTQLEAMIVSLYVPLRAYQLTVFIIFNFK